MVQHVDYDCAFEEWRPLLAACDSYASLTGWRFVLADFMHLQGRESSDLRAARELAMPLALDFADRVRACAAAVADGAAKPRLITEFEACQRIVATEAVYNSMVATVRAVGLSSSAAEGASGGGGPGAEMLPLLGGCASLSISAAASEAEEDADSFAYQDMSQPIEVIARRLLAHEARLQAMPAVRDEKQRRALHASFFVEFGLEHGLADKGDATAEHSLREFLERLGEWDGGKDNDTVRALVLGAIPQGPAERSLRSAALSWFETHKGATLVGGAIVGGVLGLLAASTVVALASSRRGR